jgi:hypothetical protein
MRRPAAALLLTGVLCWAQSATPRDLGPKIFEAQWISLGSLPADPSSIIPFPWGNDPIQEGEIEVRARGFVKAGLEGAQPQAEYTLWACKLSTVPDNRCAALGNLITDSRGNGGAVLPWPEAASGPHALFFVLTRGQVTMFVSGFYMPSGAPPAPAAKPPAAPKPSAYELELKGEITAVGSGSFAVGGVMVLVDANTRFDGKAKSFSGLQTGMDVDVKGVAAGGAILAVRVQTSGK